MTSMKVLLLTLLTVALVTPSAHAFHVSLLGGGNLTTPKASGTETYAAKLGLAGGAMLSLPLGGPLTFDIGGLYVQRKYTASTAAAGIIPAIDVTTTAKMIQVPVLIRYWLGSMLSVGAGGYYGKWIGSADLETKVGTATPTTSTASNTGRTKDDLGLAFSVAADIPIGVMTGFVIDARYNLGLKDNDTTDGTLKYRDMQGFVGLRFGMSKMK